MNKIVSGKSGRWQAFIAIGSLLLLCFISYGLFFDFNIDLIKGGKEKFLPDSKQMASALPTTVPCDVEAILKQPFYYLDKGKQSYVFLSEDGLYVLKFFAAKGPSKKYYRLLEGYHLGYEYFPRHAGLLHIHVFFNAKVNITVNLISRMGRRYFVDLNTHPFVLQRAAEPTGRALARLLKARDLEAAKKYLGMLVEMYLKEYSAGIYDADYNFIYNTGFVDGKPLHLDLGRLIADERAKDPAFYRMKMKKSFHDRLFFWLQRHFPKYRQEIVEEMDEQLLIQLR